MRVAFYSPMAEPDASVASGVQRMGMLLRRALEEAGAEVWTPKLPRTYEKVGDAQRQRALRAESERSAAALLQSIRDGGAPRPDVWFSYHVYYKSPDWIGPLVAQALQIPYLIAEGSHAPKRAHGPWALTHEGATAALMAADRLLAMTVFDRFCLDQIAPGRVRDLKPFIDVSAFSVPRVAVSGVRAVTVATMRDARKRASYLFLGEAMRQLDGISLNVAGDGPDRQVIEAAFQGSDVLFKDMVPPADIPAFLAAGDIFAWPGFGEAYGLVYLEAQASGLPVVACRDHGVPDVVRDGETALLSAPGDVQAYVANLRRLASDVALRMRMGEAGRRFARGERSVAAAARTLRQIIAEVRS